MPPSHADIAENAASHVQQILATMLGMEFSCESSAGADPLLLSTETGEENVLAVHYPIVGEESGHAYVVFPGTSLRALSEILLSQIGKSATGIEFQELSNILVGSYLTVLSNEWKKRILHSSAEGECLRQVSMGELQTTLQEVAAKGSTTLQAFLRDAEKGITVFLFVGVIGV
jgi:chemotaxis protein CheY-P-specific phosphatase CheC